MAVGERRWEWTGEWGSEVEDLDSDGDIGGGEGEVRDCVLVGTYVGDSTIKWMARVLGYDEAVIRNVILGEHLEPLVNASAAVG